MKEISVFELKEKLKLKEDLTIVDVREQDEIERAKIDGTTHIPMGDIPKRISELSYNDELVIMCKSGGRSARVCEYLTNNGFKNVTNLSGGITAWAEHIDRSVETY
tara:strand:- start:670 stop:987 length:318 start_codon:yes stop_codon:yes gene_type:complete